MERIDTNQHIGDRPNGRRPYEKPVVRTEAMFETSALACGKCMSGPVGQYQCGSLLQYS